MRCVGPSGPFPGLGYDAVPPRALNELADQGTEALIDLIMLIEQSAGTPNFCNRIVFIAKAAGGVRPIRALFRHRTRAVQASSHRGKGVGGLQHGGFLLATHAPSVERCVWEQAAWSEWATADGHAVDTILNDLIKAFDHVACQKLNDAAVRTRFPVGQLRLPRYQAAGMLSLMVWQVTR